MDDLGEIPPIFGNIHIHTFLLPPPSGSFGGQARNATWHVHGGPATLALQGVGDAVHAIGFGGEVELILQLPWAVLWVSLGCFRG